MIPVEALFPPPTLGFNANVTVRCPVRAAEQYRNRCVEPTCAPMRDASASIANGSTEIAAGSADLSQRTEEQVSPKAGFYYTPLKDTTIRGAYTRSLGGLFYGRAVDHDVCHKFVDLSVTYEIGKF